MSKLAQAVSDLRAQQAHVRIVGQGSKAGWCNNDIDAQILDVATEANGVIDYQPDELVITAFAGTPIKLVQETLSEKNQGFAFDPPQFDDKGTIGGMVASGFSGPSRKWAGSLRDAVLGVEFINGKGESLRFGGQVMKNVAGYDVSRLVAGSFGWLGVIEAASIRVHPRTELVETLVFEMDVQQALRQCLAMQRQYLPLSGTWWVDGVLHVRLSGTENGVEAACARLGGERHQDDALWQAVRDQSHPFFSGSAGTDLFRVMVPGASPPFPDAQMQALEWAGSLRWVWHQDADALFEWVRQQGGWCWQMGAKLDVEKNSARVMQALKAAFDPDNVFANQVLNLQTGQSDAH